MGVNPAEVVQFATKGVFQLLTEQVKGVAMGRLVPKPSEDDSAADTIAEYANLPELDEDTEIGTALLGDREAEIAKGQAESLPEDLFASVVGLDEEKQVLRAVYVADRPIHAVLVGPPGGAKSVILEELARAPDTQYIVGGNTTPAGLIAILEGEGRPHVLLIDELEKSSKEFQDSLLSAMSGKLVVAKHLRSTNEDIDTRFICAANSLDDPRHPVSGALRSRLHEVNLTPYDAATKARVIQAFLVQRKGYTQAEADAVAALVAPIPGSDVRDAEQIAVFYRQNPELARSRAAAMGRDHAAMPVPRLRATRRLSSATHETGQRQPKPKPPTVVARS